MTRQRVLLAGVFAALLVMVGSVGLIGYRPGWLGAPVLHVELTARAPGGAPLEGVLVQARGRAVGVTGRDGVLRFELQGEPGESVAVSAALERPGFEFKPWQGELVVRRPDRSGPGASRHALEARLEPRAIAALVEVVSGDRPVKGAAVALEGKPAGRTDEQGRVSISLGRALSRSAALEVRAPGFGGWTQRAPLVGGEVFRVDLTDTTTPAAVPGGLVAGYESLGRFVPVAQVDVRLGGKKLAQTDRAGRAALQLAVRSGRVELHRRGYLPDPAHAELGALRSGSLVVPLYPQLAPSYRIALLPLRNGSPGDASAAAALPELEDKLSDYLFALRCFEPVAAKAFTAGLGKSKRSLERALEHGWDGSAAGSLADAVVRAELALSSELVLSVEVVSVTGQRLGAFVERERPAKLRQLAENAARKIAELFPFEGHVVGEDGGGYATTLGSAGDRGLRRGQPVEIVRWSAALPPRPGALARGEIRTFDVNGSVIDVHSKNVRLKPGDKVVLLPRAREAAFSASLRLSVLAGDGASATPFPDVNVYRDGTWVGLTGEDGSLEVPVEAGRAHEFLFVRSGVEPHAESFKTARAGQTRTVHVPRKLSHLRIESEPSGARVVVDGRELGTTPLDAYVPLGFRRVQVDAGEGWRAYDQVLELRELEQSYRGAQRIVLEKDVLREAEEDVARGEVDAAIAALGAVQEQHPDYSAARNMLGGLYLDEKKDPEAAIREFESVLARPENRELVNKRFAVTFLNLGRAYYARGNPEGYERAIANLLTARDNKRFFPSERYDAALHDTLYFLALATHRLYHARPGDALLQETARRWKDYFDFFPESLQGDAEVQQARESAEQFYAEIRRKAGE